MTDPQSEDRGRETAVEAMRATIKRMQEQIVTAENALNRVAAELKRVNAELKQALEGREAEYQSRVQAEQEAEKLNAKWQVMLEASPSYRAIYGKFDKKPVVKKRAVRK